MNTQTYSLRFAKLSRPRAWARFGAFSTALVVLAAAGESATADVVTAQFLSVFNGSLGGSGYSDYAGQTFTAQASGLLKSVSFQIADGGQSVPVAFDFLNTLGGVPNAVLAEVQLPGSAVPDQYTLFAVDFSSFGIPLVAGTQYALTAKPAVTTTAFSPGWQFATGDLYAGGRGWWHPSTGWDASSTAFIAPDYDFGFQVTVVPESSSSALLLTGAVCLALLPLRRSPPDEPERDTSARGCPTLRDCSLCSGGRR